MKKEKDYAISQANLAFNADQRNKVNLADLIMIVVVVIAIIATVFFLFGK